MTCKSEESDRNDGEATVEYLTECSVRNAKVEIDEMNQHGRGQRERQAT